MIEFYSETEFQVDDVTGHRRWIGHVVDSEGFRLKELSFVFCDDEYLFKLNREYLKHDTYTDVISFDYSQGSELWGDIFISIERVKENSYKMELDFKRELRRVMAHGVLHLMGFGDKLEEEIGIMREKEEEKLKMFHVEQ